MSRKFDMMQIVSTVVIIVATVTLVTIWFSDYGESHVIGAPQSESQRPPNADGAAVEDFKRRSRGVIDAYLREHKVRKLQLGAGNARHEGWLNTDIEAGEGLAHLDASKPFPLADGAIHYVASEHVVEHLSYEDGKVMLAESFRVLAPGGKVRIATPNLLRFVELFQKDTSEAATNFMAGKIAWHEWPQEPPSAAVVLNLQLSSWGHKFTYDPETLEAALARVGFTDIRQFEMSESDDPELKGFEARTDGVHAPVIRRETMVLQATKPGQTAGTH
jgi:predicted SAM-dependent methyltransferase